MPQPRRVTIGPLWRRGVSPSVLLDIQPGERTATAQATQPPTNALLLDPEVFPPPGSRTLVLTGQVATPGAGAVLIPQMTRKIPRGYRAVFRQLQLFANLPVDATQATWAIQIDGVPLPELNAVTMIFAAANSQKSTFDTLRVPVKENQTVSVVVTNVDGAARVYGAQLVGWYWPL